MGWFRTWVRDGRWPSPKLWLWLDEMIDCPWCLGFWITGAVTAFAYYTGSVEDWLFTWLAASVVVGLLGRLDS